MAPPDGAGVDMSVESWRAKHILVGTDFSVSSRGAVGEALRLAGRWQSALSVVHIAPSGADEAALGLEMSAFLDAQNVPDGAQVHRVIRIGSRVSTALAAVAQECGCDLLVVGPRAHGFVERHIMGGIAEQLMSRTDVATLATSAPSKSGYSSVLAAVDGSEASYRALQLAYGMLEGPQEERRLVVFRALSGRGARALQGEDAVELQDALVREREAELREVVDAYVGPLLCCLDIVVRIGVFGEMLPALVDELEPRLLCMGTVGRRGLAGILAGSDAERMVGRLAIPILVAHP